MLSMSSSHEMPDVGGDPTVSSAWLSVGISNDDEVAADNLNNIQIEYPPSAAIPSQKIPFTEFTQGHRPRAYKPDLSTDPWYPFQSHLDFEFAELVLEAALNKEQVNHFLKLLKSVHSTTEVFTINEYNDIQNTWKAASHCMTAFKKEVVCIDGVDGEPHEFVMYYCSLWDWVCNLLKHPNIGPHFVVDVQHLSKFNSLSFIHFIDEPWMADKLWNIQSKLPPDGKVLLFILYTDKAKLSSFGQQKGYPVVAHLANLPMSSWNGEGIGGGHVVGWLPIIFKEYSGKPQFANFKNAVWHELFRKLLQTVEKKSETGCWVNCWDGVAHHFFPVILILSADYEEQAVMALICGVKLNFPCPICLIPCDHISEFPAQCELRTSENSTFTVIENTDVYHALSWDHLHANFTGKFGDPLWAKLLRILDKAGHQAMARVEKNFSEMPHWHMLNHFEEALSISYTDGIEVVFACHNILLQNTKKEGYLLLCCLRAYIEFDLYMNSLVVGWEVVSTFNVLMQKYAEKEDNTKKNWNFLKNHTCMHVFDDIEAKGVTCNFNTKPNEKMHGPLKEKYQNHTNFKNVAQQILDVDHLEAVSELIHCRISDYEAYMETNMQSTIGSNTNNAEHEDFFHVRLGSQIKQPLTLEAIEQRGMIDKAFMQFCMKLSKLLNRYFEVTQKPLLGGKCIQLQVNHEITEYQYIKVNFESTVDWCQYTDHLWCNPHFHGHSCYDCCIVGNKSSPLALVHPYDAPTGPRLMKDVHLNLWRSHEQPWESAEIFSVESIICSALLYPDNTRPGEHLVVDMIDTDIFLHVQMMHKAAGHH
ncbi:hypothetical protein EDD17DRAFT_1776488 [Pisolithus thermaeus]|nr:hypothetical protein EDD17DRAFT_1776488 [Pisolithus thermaeus]